jgi:hypothetical protein
MSDFGVVWAMLDVANFRELRYGEVRRIHIRRSWANSFVDVASISVDVDRLRQSKRLHQAERRVPAAQVVIHRLDEKVKVPMAEEPIRKIERAKRDGGRVCKTVYHEKAGVFAQQTLLGRLRARGGPKQGRIVLVEFDAEVLMSQDVQRKVEGTKPHQVSRARAILNLKSGIVAV